MSKYFTISGYWKDDKSEFSGHIVKEFDDVEESESDDNLIFYYGLSEQNLKDSSEDDALEFVVTSYEEIDWKK
jgi:hypothetical protein